MRTPDSGYGIHPKTGANTVAFWPFDKASGTLAYDVFGGRNLTNPTALWATGLIGSSVMFTGGGGIIYNTATGADAGTLQGAYSFEAWVRVMAAPGSQASMIEYSDPSGATTADNTQFSLQVKSNLAFRWEWKGASVQAQDSTAKLRAGVWQHIAVTKEADGSGTFTVKSYLNGVLDNTQTTVSAPTGGGDAFWNFGTGKGGNFTGAICSAHLTTTVLTSTQIVENWRRGVLWDDPTAMGHGVTELQVTVQPSWSGGTAFALSSYIDSFDFVEGFELSESIDQQCITASLSLKRSVYGISLSPLIVESMANQNPQPSISAPGPASSTFAALLHLGGAITVYARRRAAGTDDAIATAGAVIFEGTIDALDFGSETIEVEARDAGASLIDTYIETEADYNTGSDATIEATIQAVLNAASAGVTLYTPTTPSVNLGEFRQRRESLMQASQSKADQIGWVTKYRFDPLTKTWRFTFYDPERARTRFDGVVMTSDYSEFGGLSQKLDDVRNAVRVAYRNSAGQASGVDDNGNPIYPPASVTVVDASSVTAYGRRFMEISDAACPNIDTETEATAMAEAILNDLSTPQLQMSFDLPYWEIEIGDRLKVAENSRTFDTAQTFAVTGRQVSFAEGIGSTSLTLQETPASARQKHLVKEARNGRALPPVVSVADSPTDFGVRGLYAPMKNLVMAANMLADSPSLAGVQNPGFLVHPSGVNAPPIGWSLPSGNWGSAADVYFSDTSQSGDRSAMLRTVNSVVQSRWMPVISNRVYEARVTWQGSVVTDRLRCDVAFYTADRNLKSTATAFDQVVTSTGTFQTDAGFAEAPSDARWARVSMTKIAGPTILVDRVTMNVVFEGFQASLSGATPQSAGTGTIKWDAEAFDYGGVYNPGTGLYTALETGYHIFHFYASVIPISTGALTGFELAMKVDTGGGAATVWSSSYSPASGTNFGDQWLHTPPTYLNTGHTVQLDITVPVDVNIAASTGGGGRWPHAQR